MTRNIIVKPLSCLSIERHKIEMCEHKGIGHPDSICDGVCEAASRELSLAYLEAYGQVLHHNLDKGLLVAGRSAPRFGGGQFLDPIRIIIAGRATHPDGGINPQEIAVAAARRYLAQNIRCDPERFQIATEIKEGSANLKEVFARRDAVPLANDTSFGVGYAPYSRLEQAVLAIAQVLKSGEFRQHFPAAGDDFKIMGHRVNGETGFTIALAFIDRHVADVSDYFSIKRTVGEYLRAHLETPAGLRINTLDDPAAKDANGLYLTVSGLSAEMGDDGEVGRGNRVNGLITPNRLMSLEAAAGKNPLTHVGKLYNVLAMLMAQDIYENNAEVEEVRVQLLSAIGEPINRPQIAAIEISAKPRISGPLRKKVTTMADDWLGNTSRITCLILEQGVMLY